MPPKKGGKKDKKRESKVIRIDPNRHADKIAEIKQAHKEEEIIEEDEEDEYDVWGEEDMLPEEEDGISEFEFLDESGRIDLSFFENFEEFSESIFCYPPSYYTLSNKERLLLLYAENFRKQFMRTHPRHRPLVMVMPNECHVQKFVCSTVRPTAFAYPTLIGSAKGIAEFVADFIIYEPLEDLLKFPSRLISPSTLLRRRRGNSFEMAILLCSMLIGAGYVAYVVSGVARKETVLNDQQNVEYPYEIIDIDCEDKVNVAEKRGQKYKLRSIPDLESHLEENMMELIKEKEREEQLVQEETLRLQQEEMELVAIDRHHYKRSHAWVAIIENAPWTTKQAADVTGDNDVTSEPIEVTFIEPSTGFFCKSHCKQYILIDSIWNHQNYYVNIQTYQRISEIRWDLRNTTDWEHLLPAEPPEMRIYAALSDENLQEKIIEEEKHLDTIRTWVMKLDVGLLEFDQRFPKLGKTIRYKQALHERFSPYSQQDGKVMQITLFADEECQTPTYRWEYFQNRADLLKQMKFSFETQKIEETFEKGRNDSLKYMEHFLDPNQPKKLVFYSAPRVDCMELLYIHVDRIILKYNNRSDLRSYQEFEFKPVTRILKTIYEKFEKGNDEMPANKNVSARTFLISQRKILLKFHYKYGALTASTFEFTKPPRPNYGQEIRFDPNLIKIYKANVAEPDPTPLELYKVLLEQLQCEEIAKKQFYTILDEINHILQNHSLQMNHPVLKFSMFDALRNRAAKNLRMKQKEEEETHKRELATKPADFLAPYLVPFKNRELTNEESESIFSSCLNDLKTRFVGLLNELQRQYEDLTFEGKSLKRFLDKFEDQFSNFDYDRLVKEAKDIELNKRMIQQRLKITHEQSQKKYESLKQSLLKDPRLYLQKSLS